MPELLLEFRSEELPARTQRRAAEDLARLLRAALAERGLDYACVKTAAGPRRLAACARGVPKRQPDLRDERRGPRVGAPERAIRGFLRAAGLESLAQCEERETPKGRFHFAVVERKGRATVDLLPEIAQSVAAALPWPKSMRWGEARLRWARPLRGVLCVFDGELVPGALALGGGAAAIPFSNETVGHRWMAPEPFAVSSFAEYTEKLEAARVVADSARRAEIIETRGRALAEAEGLRFDPDRALLEEVAGLVEWPVPLLGRIDDAFMELPPEVLATAMTSHQKYFPLATADGALASRFLMAANVEAPDGGAAIIRGNERVLRARLHDAAFFWTRDREAPLESRVPRLDGVVFHARLGSVGDKVRRLETLAPEIAKFVRDADPDSVARAARLCKADLVTGMVGEFPALQGVMGRYYARHDGEADEVADAIAGHYMPIKYAYHDGENDEISGTIAGHYTSINKEYLYPEDPVSVALALADRLDTLAGFFMIGERPTGSKDPFALRRAAISAIRVILLNDVRIPLRSVLLRAAMGHSANNPDAVAQDVLNFAMERLRVDLLTRNMRHDLLSAVFAASGDDDMVNLHRKADSLHLFLDRPDGANLLSAYRRASNIVRIEEKKDGVRHGGGIDSDALVEPAEMALNESLNVACQIIDAELKKGNFGKALRALAELREPVDRFFAEVRVNDEDSRLRENRLRLLARIRDSLSTVADFSLIKGS